MPADIVCVASLKGGVGKTTTAFALGCAGAAAGMSVVVLDLDAQVALTRQLQVPQRGPDGIGLTTVLEVLTGQGRLKDALVDVRDGFWVVRGSKDLYSLVMKPEQLRALLSELKAQHDLVVIDTEPGKRYIQSAMQLSDVILVPTGLDTVALPGACDTLQQALDLGIGGRICGMLATNVRRPMTRDARELLESIRAVELALASVMYSTVRWPAALSIGSLDGNPDLAEFAGSLLTEVLETRCRVDHLAKFVPMMLSLVEPAGAGA
ncbi:MAG: ParA family protein [Candidatus Dormibacteria bacterium]